MIGVDLGIWRGQAASFNPLSLSPLAWWDWSDATKLYTDSGLTTLVSADGDPIGGVRDKSGSNYNLTQTDGTAKGLYKTNIRGGYSVGRTDGVNDYWQVASSTALFKSLHYGGATLFFSGKVGTANNVDAAYGVVASFGAASPQIGYALFYDGRAAIPSISRASVSVGSGSVIVLSSGTWANNLLASNTPIVLTSKIDPQNATVGNRSYIYSGSGAANSGNTSTGTAVNTSSSSNLTVGAINSLGTLGSFGPNDYYEILIFASLLSDVNRTAVTNYLMSKWGVS